MANANWKCRHPITKLLLRTFPLDGQEGYQGEVNTGDTFNRLIGISTGTCVS